MCTVCTVCTVSTVCTACTVCTVCTVCTAHMFSHATFTQQCLPGFYVKPGGPFQAGWSIATRSIVNPIQLPI